jgi:hypothetical protein
MTKLTVASRNFAKAPEKGLASMINQKAAVMTNSYKVTKKGFICYTSAATVFVLPVLVFKRLGFTFYTSTLAPSGKQCSFLSTLHEQCSGLNDTKEHNIVYRGCLGRH